MNLLILAAGGSEEFDPAIYRYPKMLIEAGGIPIIEHVARALHTISGVTQTTFVVRRSDNERYHVGDVAKLIIPEADVISAPDNTKGAACTALLAVDAINNDRPLIIAAGDQLIEGDMPAAVSKFMEPQIDGGIITFRATHPRWSFVRVNTDGYVTEAAEKRPISNVATAGFYFFSSGRDFVTAAMDSIRKDDSTGGSFFIAPVYNQLILRNRRIITYDIPRSHYWHFGTPQGVSDFARHLQAR